MKISPIVPLIQPEFRSGHSTTAVLLKIFNDIATAIDSSKCTILVLLNQFKAFDLVNIELLLAICSYIGFGKAALRRFSNYLHLHGRKQKIKINDTLYSNLREIVSGVPQGRIMGPILFLLCTFEFT